LRDRYPEVEAAGLTVLGISFDSQQANRAFKEKYDFPFRLLCDTERTVGQAYGADRGAGGARRISYVIGKGGKIEHALDRVNADTHLDDVLALLS
jgi:peroxiredoxin Q/BCP